MATENIEMIKMDTLDEAALLRVCNGTAAVEFPDSVVVVGYSTGEYETRDKDDAGNKIKKPWLNLEVADAEQMELLQKVGLGVDNANLIKVKVRDYEGPYRGDEDARLDALYNKVFGTAEFGTAFVKSTNRYGNTSITGMALVMPAAKLY